MQSVAGDQNPGAQGPVSQGPVSGVAGRYARALFELSESAAASDATLAELETFTRALAASEDLRSLVNSPLFSSEDQLAALGALAKKLALGALAANFLKLMARNRRLSAAQPAIAAFRALLAEKRGAAIADVVSAEPLGEAKIEALKSAIRTAIGKDVTLNTRIDPSLIGGMTVKIGSRMIDTSLKTKLSQLKLALKEVR